MLNSSGAEQVDSNKDGLLDLKELSTALSKLLALVANPLSMTPAHPFATARNMALDIFIALKQDPRRSARHPPPLDLYILAIAPGYCTHINEQPVQPTNWMALNEKRLIAQLPVLF